MTYLITQNQFLIVKKDIQDVFLFFFLFLIKKTLKYHVIVVCKCVSVCVFSVCPPTYNSKVHPEIKISPLIQTSTRLIQKCNNS